MQKFQKKTKYKNKKVAVDGIKFDSVAESKYYLMLKRQGLEFKMQESFVLQPKFEFRGKKYRAITYKPDFTIYENGELVKVVDVKGVQTDSFKIKAKMFVNVFETELILAKYDRRSGLFVETKF